MVAGRARPGAPPWYPRGMLASARTPLAGLLVGLILLSLGACGGVDRGREAVEDGRGAVERGRDAVRGGRETFDEQRTRIDEAVDRGRTRLAGSVAGLRRRTDTILDCQVRACAVAAVAQARTEVHASVHEARRLRDRLPEGACRSAAERYARNLIDYGQTLSALPIALGGDDPVATRVARAAIAAARAQLSPNTDPTLGAVLAGGRCLAGR